MALNSAMTTANKVTILRILLIPFFVVEVLYYMKTGIQTHRVLAISVFAVAAICDGVDGFIARRFNQRSELGAILDPLADKLLLVSGVILFSLDDPRLGSIPLWLTGTIIGRDLLLLIGLVVTQMMVGKVTVRPRVLGKDCHRAANALHHLGPAEVGHIFERRVVQDLDDGCGDLHGHIRPALHLGSTKQLGSHPTSTAAPKQGQS